ncbi:putative lipid II flippase FtsW [Anaeromyxobacter sp. SG17]|uniref:putative lipid II flippase FtsW n=1 Tax=Anaeromyxobacter sp. SG17 TaxID=2925405 RepID=UPI001F55FF37|nr:putative lipid II flippase FtsW [Anaeromyxobacter sp. SG17]
MSRAEDTSAPRAGAHIDGLLLGALLALTALGAVMVYSASAIPASQSARLGHDEFYYLKRQLLAAGVGVGLLVAALRLGARRISALAYPLLAVTFFTLLLVPVLGKTAGGAQRWIPLGPLQFQPAEAAKVALVLYLARSLARKQEKVRIFSIGLLPHLLVTGALVALCLWQSDMGTGVILFLVLFAMLFAAGARVSYLLGAGLLALPVAWHLVKSTPYRYERVMAFLDPERYRYGPGFQLWESLLGTAHGGWLGQGLGQGKGKLFYLPAAHTDFIAAVIAEETGLLGILLLVSLYAVVVWRGVRAALHASEPFGCYAALGVTSLVGAQALVNLAVVFGLLPTKGLTLPFVSYGGSSLMTLLGAAGVLLTVSGERGGFLRRAPSAVIVRPGAERSRAAGDARLDTGAEGTTS